MKLSKEKPQTETQQFSHKFQGKKKNFSIECDTSGHILRCKTKDKDIIKYLKLKNYKTE